MDQVFRNKQLGPKASAWQDEALFLTAKSFQTPASLAQLSRLKTFLKHLQKSCFDMLFYVTFYPKNPRKWPLHFYTWKKDITVNFIFLEYKYDTAVGTDNN